jgi:hypothetical protein
MPYRRRLVAQKPHTRRTDWVSRPVTRQQCTIALSSSPTLSSQLPVSSPQRSPLSLQRSILGTILNTLRCESIRRPSARQTPKSKYPTLPTLHHVSPRAIRSAPGHTFACGGRGPISFGRSPCCLSQGMVSSPLSPIQSNPTDPYPLS